MKLIVLLTCSLHRMAEQIARVIDDTESIIRFVYSPFHVKKDKLRREAFLPPKFRTDVSVQRLRYSDEDICRQIGMSQQRYEIPTKEWKGMAGFKADTVLAKAKNNEPIQLVSSPIDSAGEYRKIEEIIFSDDPGLPAHADILYDYHPVEGEALPVFVKEYAQYICEKSRYFADPNPSSAKWEGNPVVLI